MSSEDQESNRATDQIGVDRDAVCDSCGRYGAYRFAGQTLCEECYASRGSCCPEFGKDDLWSSREEL